MRNQSSFKGLLITLAMSGLCCVGILSLAQAQPSVEPQPGLGIYALDSFGPVKTPTEADATIKKAMDAIKAKGGGTLIVLNTAPENWVFANTNQDIIRNPAPPAPATQWSTGVGVTVVDTRGGTLTVHPPQATGLHIDRTLRLPEGQSMGSWGYSPLLSLDNNVVRGSTSYDDYLQADVKAGKAQRFYVATVRGLFPGIFLNVHTQPGWYDPKVDRVYVQSIGYDKEKKMSYFIADAALDHKAGTLIHNKNHTNGLKIDTNSHTENQTFDVFNMRHDYSQGDTYLYDAYFNYMSNIHSSAGDENGVCFAGFTESETNIFRGTVARVNPEKDEVVFSGEANANTLGTGRPLINLNPKKWITQGTVLIVRPGTFWDVDGNVPGLVDPVFEGKTYPSSVAKNPRTGIPALSIGGLIRFSADAPLTADVVGRFFAVDEPTEYVPNNGPLRRWFRIVAFKANANGTKEIRIERFFWGSKEAGAPTLYSEDNYTSDGHVKPLKYVIAPGSNVYDVSRGVINIATQQPYQGGTSERTLLVSPYEQRGTQFDFEPGDPIEQAIGSDPFIPVPFRAYAFDQVPGQFPTPFLDIQNHGVVPRYAGIQFLGQLTGVNKDVAPWDKLIMVDGKVGTVLDLQGEATGPVMRITQQTRSAPILWYYDGGKKEATMTVDNKTGNLEFKGGALSLSGGLTAAGISGGDKEAHNLRGVNIPVPAASKTFFVKFPRPEDDANYAVFLETSWLTQRAITEQKPDGFTVTFADAAPENAKLHWTLIR